MFDDDFLYSLPDDPEEALAEVYKTLKGKLDTMANEQATLSNSGHDIEGEQRSLLIKIAAFIAAHGIDLNISRQAPSDPDNFLIFFINSIEEIEFYVAKTSIERVSRNKTGITAVYVLQPALKLEIHHYLNSIREIISTSSLTDTKRTALSNKLNAFAAEVDRDRTKIEALAAAIVWTRKEIIKGAKGLEPIIEKMDKMFQSMSKATEFIRLPSRTEENKKLSGPTKRIEGPKHELDEEVPF